MSAATAQAKLKPKPRPLPPISPLAPQRTARSLGRRGALYPELNYSQIAQAIQVSPTHLGRVFNGLRRPSMQMAQKLAAYMGWTIDQVNGFYVRTKPGKSVKTAKGTK